MLTLSPITASPVDVLALFPSHYQQARESFLDAAEAAGCLTTSWPLTVQGAQGETLAIDVARWGSPTATRWLLVTSGVHGAEGPFGTAVQVGFLRLLSLADQQHVGVLVLHAVNPYGYSWSRRANEDNVDLNRNFLLPGDAFQGAHPLYHHVYQTFGPERRVRFYENYYLQAWWLIARHTRAALQSSLPTGQYDYPKGLFFGGQGPEQSQQCLKQNLRDWIPHAGDVAHLDFHTGLGRWGDCRLLIDVTDAETDANWFRSRLRGYGVEHASENRTAYSARGSFGPWMKQVLFPQVQYRYAAAEFGTYRPVRVLHSLVKELHAHYRCQSHDTRYRRAKGMIRETFVPASSSWRQMAASSGIELCRQVWLSMDKDQ